MEIKAVKFRRDGFYTQPFVMGGEEGMEKFDKNVRYYNSLELYQYHITRIEGHQNVNIL